MNRFSDFRTSLTKPLAAVRRRRTPRKRKEINYDENNGPCRLSPNEKEFHDVET
jgi:hypothetical protein